MQSRVGKVTIERVYNAADFVPPKEGRRCLTLVRNGTLQIELISPLQG